MDQCENYRACNDREDNNLNISGVVPVGVKCGFLHWGQNRNYEVFRKIFGPKSDKVSKQFRILCNKELHYIYK